MNKQRTLGKSALSYILCMTLVLSGLMVPTQQVRAEETPEVEIGAIVASGDCGATANDDVTWELTKNGEVDGNDTYTITIKGNGAMADYASETEQPWAEKREDITKTVIGYGVTRIGEYAFLNLENVEEVIFERNENGESSVESIELYSFGKNMSLKEIVIPHLFLSRSLLYF